MLIRQIKSTGNSGIENVKSKRKVEVVETKKINHEQEFNQDKPP